MTAPAWEVVAGCTYVLTADDVPGGWNKLGMDVSSIPLDVPLCGFCDQALPSDGRCEDCRTIHVLDLTVEAVGGGWKRVAA